MMRRKQPLPSLLLTGFFLLAHLGARAETGAYMTGRNLALLCQSAKPEDQFSCQSYIAGIIDYHRLLKSLGTAPSVDFCIPAAIRMAHIKTVVLSYILRHSEHQDFIAAPGVTMSLFNSFPCRKRE